MANNKQNLIPQAQRSPEEAREMGRKGGKASGKARRRKKDIKQKMKLLLSLPADANDREELAVMGVDPDDMDNEMVLVKSLFLAAADGDTRAFDRIMDLVGKTVAREELAIKKEELKKKTTPSNGALEDLIVGLQEDNDDLHAQTTGPHDALETE